jgi:hypothetical protein
MKNRHIFILVLAALLIRLIPAFFVYGSADVDNFRALSELMKQGKWCLYSYTDHNPYPPLLSWLVYALRVISDHSGLAFSFVLKIPAIIADIFTSILIYGIVLKTGKARSRAFFWGLVYALNPVAIMVSAVHGQFDPLVMFFCLYSLYWFYFREKNLWLSAICLGIGIWLKGFPLILLPLYLIKLDSGQKRWKYAFWAFLPMVISFIPYLLADPYSIYNTVIKYSSKPDNWGYTLLISVMKNHFSWPALSGVYLFSVAYGKFLLLAILAAFYMFCAPKAGLLKAHVLVFTVFYSFTAGGGLQYMIWVIAFAVLGRGWFIWVFSVLAGLWMFISYLPVISSGLYRIISGTIGENTLWRLAVLFSLSAWASCIVWTCQGILGKRRAEVNG